MKEKEDINCSFCGRNKSDVNIMIGGLTGHICDTCVQQAMKIVDEEQSIKLNEQLSESLILLKPHEIKNKLDDYVIGQENAKRVLSVAVYNHFKRITQLKNEDEVEIEKSNVIMVGETGTGKTLLAKTIARILNVPFAIADATVLTEAGYVGEDVESILSRLLQASDYKPELAEKGIVFIDEIDKIARKSDNPSITRDVSGEGVQQALLKLLEGAVIGVPPYGGRKHPEQKLVEVDTSNILFICGGAFAGIEKNISRRINKQPIGYTSKKKDVLDESNLLQYISPTDLRTFGLIPELIGRFPVLTHLGPLSRQALKSILTEPKNSLVRQYKKLFDMEGVELEFEEDVLEYIVDKAIEFKLGARGLRSICEAIMLDLMYDLPQKKEAEKERNFVVTIDYAKSQLDSSGLNILKVA
ncbi:MAG TPA: ATP-dependent Clp protease ATP-binding subunit ClpX [Flavobacteriales bacterium]|jgi:ATP-dependent Clp protease ATP-binding subunit ClpX|nr:ATP-dependent Clp protease ATP-binding subunit ClpX [Flavobacteriales bacterium]